MRKTQVKVMLYKIFLKSWNRWLWKR